MVAVRLCTPFSQADMSAARGESVLQRGTPGSARAEAERRRAIALKALDQRLQAASGGNSASRPGQATSQPPGPGVETKSQPSTQTAMRAQPGPLLGETKFEPDHDDSTSH